MTEKQTVILSKLMRRKAWVFAARMINALDKAEDRIATQRLQFIAGCEKGQTHLVIKTVRDYYEGVIGTTLDNLRGFGYRVGADTDDTLNELTKISARALSHHHRHRQVSALLPPEEKVIDPDERAAFVMHRMFGHIQDALFNIEGDIKRHLMTSEKNKERLLTAASESRAPMKEFGLGDDIDDVAAANRAPKDPSKDPK